MKTLRTSKVLALFGALAVVLAVSLVATPSAEAGHGFGYGTYYPPVSTHYVAPVYPSCNYYTPTYYPLTYPTPYYGHGCYRPW